MTTSWLLKVIYFPAIPWLTQNSHLNEFWKAEVCDYWSALLTWIPATLLERGRHAAYILLTGPDTQGVQGTVVLSKRKLKQDVPESNVRYVGIDRGSETEDDIKEAFSRLRFSDWIDE